MCNYTLLFLRGTEFFENMPARGRVVLIVEDRNLHGRPSAILTVGIHKDSGRAATRLEVKCADYYNWTARRSWTDSASSAMANGFLRT
jgi:hypothetical protein